MAKLSASPKRGPLGNGPRQGAAVSYIIPLNTPAARRQGFSATDGRGYLAKSSASHWACPLAAGPARPRVRSMRLASRGQSHRMPLQRPIRRRLMKSPPARRTPPADWRDSCPASASGGTWLGTFLEEGEDARLEDLVADRKHMIAVRDIEGACSGNERGERLRRSRDLVLGAHGD